MSTIHIKHTFDPNLYVAVTMIKLQGTISIHLLHSSTLFEETLPDIYAELLTSLVSAGNELLKDAEEGEKVNLSRSKVYHHIPYEKKTEVTYVN